MQETIYLVQLKHNAELYEVTKLINSVRLNVGECVTKEYIKDVLHAQNVKTVIGENK